MKKPAIGAILFLVFVYACPAQMPKGMVELSRVPKPGPHYQPEYSFDTPVDTASWSKLTPGLHVSFGSTDELYLRSEVPGLQKPSDSWEDTGWKGERLNAQVLLWSPDTIEQVRLSVSDLVNAKGQVLKKDNCTLNLVRYVLSNYPYGATNVTCEPGPSDTAYLMPDRFESFGRFELPGRTLRPIWLSVNIPVGTPAGMYQGTVEVRSDKHKSSLQLKVNVQNQTLPEPKDWKYRLDLWQNPWVVAWYYQLEPWSPEHKALLKKHLKLYADAGGKYITTYTVHSPWSDNSYMLEGTMIEWIKLKNDTWKFDYSIFDQYVELAMEVGISEAITIYTPVPWGHRFRYIDERSGNYVSEEWSPESEKFSTFWNIFLDDLKKHLQKKGWLEKTYLGINENPLKYTLAAAKVIRANSNSWKITYAGDWHNELENVLDDYSPIINSEPSLKQVQSRKSKGFTTTYYVCCNPPKPNNFVFSPPVEGRYVSWYAAAHGYDGFLRWAYDAWPADPLRDARHTLWPAGDCFLVYPGGASSIRFEKLREGIVDFEKMNILKRLAARSPDKKIKNSWKEFEVLLSSFVGDPDYSKREYNVQIMKASVDKGRAMISALSDRLSP